MPFIDEAAELDPSAQRWMLGALTSGVARIVFASRCDLDAEVQTGRFSDELFRRLVAARIELPPLRRRRGDVALLARHFAGNDHADPMVADGDHVERILEQDLPFSRAKAAAASGIARRYFQVLRGRSR